MTRRTRRRLLTGVALTVAGLTGLGTAGALGMAIDHSPIWGELGTAAVMTGLLLAWALASIITTPAPVRSTRGRFPAEASKPALAARPGALARRAARLGVAGHGAWRMVVRRPA